MKFSMKLARSLAIGFVCLMWIAEVTQANALALRLNPSFVRICCGSPVDAFKTATVVFSHLSISHALPKLGNSEIGASIVQSNSIDVVCASPVVRCETEYVALHGRFGVDNAVNYSLVSNGVKAVAGWVPKGEPRELRQVVVILGTDDGYLSLCKGDRADILRSGGSNLWQQVHGVPPEGISTAPIITGRVV